MENAPLEIMKEDRAGAWYRDAALQGEVCRLEVTRTTHLSLRAGPQGGRSAAGMGREGQWRRDVDEGGRREGQEAESGLSCVSAETSRHVAPGGCV